jgi:preprotein translocase subunit SecE
MFEVYLKANWAGLLLVATAIILAALILKFYGSIMRTFTGEVRVELTKASWPWEPKERGFKKYKELVDSTLIVVIAMLLLAGYVAFWDFVLVTVVGRITQ